jgi:peptide/nickel transport system substrate-binding protein
MHHLDHRLAYSPQAAKALLSEAGYRDGFRVTLDCPNNRYINDEAICRAVAAQLGQVGIAVTPKERHFRKIRNRETDFYLVGWAEATVDSQNVLLNFFHSRGSGWNAAGYTNPQVDELIDPLDGEIVTYARDALIEQVWRIVLDDIVIYPLASPGNRLGAAREPRSSVVSIEPPDLPPGAAEVARGRGGVERGRLYCSNGKEWLLF